MPGKSVLLVEGLDDEHVLKHICGQRGIPKLDEITPMGSVERLLQSFPVRLLESDLRALGVIVDADTDLSSRWRSFENHLRSAGYPDVPQEPDPTGTVLEAPPTSLLPRVGIWLMPNNQTNGILEDFLRFLVPNESRLFAHVESSVASIPADERRFTDLAESKAKIHTWLAWQEKPGRPLGTAITAKFLNADAAPVDILVSWLRRLFSQ